MTAIDLTDVLPYEITCETCGCHEEGEYHRSVDAPTRCVECRDRTSLLDPA